MTERVGHDIVRCWIRYQLEGDPSDFWSIEDLMDLVSVDPLRAWDVVTAIWTVERSPIVLAVLAAGPIEELLKGHGRAIIPRVKDFTRNHREFGRVLEGVYRSVIEEEVWNEIQAAIAECAASTGN